MLWENKVVNPALVSHLSKLQLAEFVKANPDPISRPLQASSSWSPFSAGWVKINVDGYFLPGLNVGGVGGVFHDKVGIYAGGFVRQISPASSPTMVEFLAVRKGICWVVERNLD